MIRHLATLLIAIWPGLLAAQAIDIRSGDHNGYTRLVFYFPEPPTWSLGRTERGFALRIEEDLGPYDLDGVFRPIGRRRLLDLSVSEDERQIELISECRCHVLTYAVTPRILAVDIRDGPPAPDNPYEAPLPALSVAEEQTTPPVEIAGLAPPPTPELSALPERRPGDGRPVSAPLKEAWSAALSSPPEPAMPDLPDFALTGPPANPADYSRVQETEARLVQEIARAAAQGLLSAAPAGSPQLERFLGPLASDATAHIAAETSMDSAFSDAPRPPKTGEGGSCIPDTVLAVQDWGTEPPDWTQVGDLRASLLGEFDAPDAEVAATLTRLYLYLGFGAEARGILDGFAPDLPEGPVLRTLAAVIDRIPPAAEHPLRGMADCDGAAAMWSVLAMPAADKAGAIDAQAVTRTLSELPLHLRRHLGPDLADIFLARGDEDTAYALRNAIGRAPGIHGPRFDQVEASIALLEGSTEQAEATLETLVEENSIESANALISLFDIWQDGGIAPEESDISLAEAMAYEYRRSETGDTLLLHAIRARAARGETDAAEDLLARADWFDGTDSSYAIEAADAILSALVTDAGNAAFLTALFSNPARYRDLALPQETRIAAAKRLIALGFDEEAQRYLDSGDDSDAARMIRAEAALSRGRPENAMAALAGLDTQEAARLRGEALAAMTEHAAAAEAFAASGAPERGLQEAWNAGDWTRLQQEATGAQQLLAERMAERQASQPEATAAPPSLAGSAEVLRRSAESRAALRALLDDGAGGQQ